ncbi:hypothetical protein [Hyunsoonleella aestuarii]|uniref:WD40 repeat domain-containing protein n=1 Tax=Hyunsoonleella aestuarii TaxID=912802 RepID=A0ABP8E998_9FLAO|nr:hypothetical protein [Hyunsoonleella aestuarii]
MKIFSLLGFLVFLPFTLTAQETVRSNSFSVRDFIIEKDSIFLIEKRNVMYYDLSVESSQFHSYFIGGYGLEIYNDERNNEIITVSNEFIQNVCSLRFYNKSSKKVEQVYYYKGGKSLDVLIIQELKYAILSLSNNKIIVVDFSKKPTFEIIHDIQLNSVSRKIIYQGNKLYYAADHGNIYVYDLSSEKSSLIYSYGKEITDFFMDKRQIIFSTIDGEVINYNKVDNGLSKLVIENDFVLNMINFQEDKLVCGTFKGQIIIINYNDMSIINKLKYHKQSVIKIINNSKNEFYSSSIDKTIKKWTLN